MASTAIVTKSIHHQLNNSRSTQTIALSDCGEAVLHGLADLLDILVLRVVTDALKTLCRLPAVATAALGRRRQLAQDLLLGSTLR
jgi:hypothetical protein